MILSGQEIHMWKYFQHLSLTLVPNSILLTIVTTSIKVHAFWFWVNGWPHYFANGRTLLQNFPTNVEHSPMHRLLVTNWISLQASLFLTNAADLWLNWRFSHSTLNEVHISIIMKMKQDVVYILLYESVFWRIDFLLNYRVLWRKERASVWQRKRPCEFYSDFEHVLKCFFEKTSFIW